MNETFMKEKPILPLLTSMALPMVISMMVNALYNIVDSLFVARINENAMTALSLVFPIQNFVNALAIGFGVGINALIAYFLGAGDKKGADRAATQGLVLALIHGVVVTVLSISIMPAFLDMFTNDVQVYQMGMEYAVIVFAFSTITMANLSFEKIFQSVGRMKVSMIGLLCGSITNIILDPLLIFGIGIFPRLGIAGAAIATAIGQLCTLLLYLTVYNKRPIPVKIRKEYLAFHKETDHRPLLDRSSCHLKSCPAIAVSIRLKRYSGSLLPDLCSHSGNLLQITDLPLSSGKRHCPGHASADRL